jgi:hypothetical protein
MEECKGSLCFESLRKFDVAAVGNLSLQGDPEIMKFFHNLSQFNSATMSRFHSPT